MKGVSGLVARAMLVSLALAMAGAGGARAEDFSPYVDGTGAITVPADFRTWTFLGTWAVAGGEDGGASEFHNVYAQPETVAAYRRTGTFPDGAVLVKELFEAETAAMTTGQVSRAGHVTGWFVMIKDAKGRFPDNPLWGDGWGWALFYAEDPKATVTEDYRADCIACHTPAKQTDWVFVEGYPILAK